MNTVDEIRTAIKTLTLEERAEITAELCGWTEDDRDRQMKTGLVGESWRPLPRRRQVHRE